jgi:glycosyltransferase involved in cell wall biosynthesis
VTGVVVDVQGVQSRAHGERGIARYLTGLALELEARHRELVESYVLNPDLPPPTSLESLMQSGRLGYDDRALAGEASAFHMGSPIELDVHLERLWPSGLRRLPLVVTLYDLIPEIFADHYLSSPGLRRRYRTRLQVLHSAARVLAISESTARDAVARLGLAPNRVVSVGAGVSDHFRRPASHAEAVDAAVKRLPFVRPGFVLYTGGIEFRKNIDRLLIGYSSLPKHLREAHQLVIVCRVIPSERPAIDARLAELGLLQQVVFPGVVTESDLVLLYQAAELFVFPSLYEGFGLPVAEAMACGAPVLAARTSSLVELVDDDDALFEPTEPRAIAVALRKGLGDPDFRARLRERGLGRSWRWSSVADRTAEVYDDVSRRRMSRRRRQPRLAFVSPLPPQMSGVADYSYRLLQELTKLVEVDVFTDFRCGSANAPDGLTARSTPTLERVEGACGGYDHVLACLGNSEHHVETLALLRRRPLAVLAHDVRLTGLYGWISRRRPDIEPRSFREVLRELHARRLPPGLGKHGWLDFTDYERHRVLMTREVVERSRQFLVHSVHAAELARLEAGPAHANKIRVVPFGYPDPRGSLGPSDGTSVATFGVVAPVKQTERIVEAFALVAARRSSVNLAIVGPAPNEELRRVQGVASRLGVATRVVVTGEVSSDEFNARLSRASVAVQLRAASNGETSASVADCLAAGVPTIATALGSTRELPKNAFVPVARDISATDLAEKIEALLDDPVRRRALSEASRAFAKANSFARAALEIVDVLFGESARFQRAA